MDDSSLFMEWAMDTLQQHDHPPAAAAYHLGGGDAFVPSLQELRGGSTLQADQVAAQDGHRHRAANSWSSGDVDSTGGGGGGGTGNTSSAVVEQHDDWSSNSVQCAPSSSVGSTNYRPVSWNFTSAVAQPSSETTAPNPCLGATPSIPCDGSGAPYGSPRASAKRAATASTGHTSSPKPYAQDHIMAERKRREKINRLFIELSTVIPGLKKMDKATILSDAVRYVKEQQEKLKALEDRNGGGGRTLKSALLAKKQCIAAAPDGDCGGGCPSPSSAAGTNRNVLREIEARVSESESSVMVRIHCEDGKGVLVGLLAEVEGLHLTITNTSVISFPACTLVITVVAKMEEGFSVTSEDIVARLNSALLHRNSSTSSAS